jgi:hypothetical protein
MTRRAQFAIQAQVRPLADIHVRSPLISTEMQELLTPFAIRPIATGIPYASAFGTAQTASAEYQNFSFDKFSAQKNSRPIPKRVAILTK